MAEQVLHKESVEDFRHRATMGVAITGLIFLTPFAINNFYRGRIELGVASVVIITVLALIAWTLRRGHYHVWLIFAGLVPTTIAFLIISYHQQGIIGALWCFPAVPAFYFILPERHAWFANLLLLVMGITNAWLLIDPDIAMRISITLLITSIFSGIFVRVIIRQQMRLAQSEEQRRESMANASHELRTPLANQLARIQAMRDGVRPMDQEQLTSLYHSTKHLGRLVDDLYMLMLADVNALACHKEREQLDVIVDDVASASREMLSEHQLTLKTVIESPLFVNGDAKHLHQIIDNLLGNAYRYATHGGTVTVTLKRKAGMAVLTVSDSGPGVSDEALTHLFERYYRVDRSRSRDRGGSGLGLSLVKVLVDAHDGQVEAYHSDEGGLGIRIKLPCINGRSG